MKELTSTHSFIREHQEVKRSGIIESKNTSLSIHRKIHFSMGSKGRQEIKPGPARIRDTANGRIPRIARLMALAVRFDQMIADGLVCDQAELAELGHVSRARVTQIMNLLSLAPEIQEELLHWPPIVSGKDPMVESHLRSLTRELLWTKQRVLWNQLKNSVIS